MQQLMWFGLSIALAFCGGWLADKKLHLPAGRLLGAMIAVAALAIGSGQVWYPEIVFFLVKVSAGLFVGARFQRRDILALKTLILPALLLVFWMLLFNILSALIVTACTQMGLLTALLSTSPAGLTEMSILAADIGAEAAVVTFMQTIRLSVVVGVFPLLVRRLSAGYRQRQPKPHTQDNTMPCETNEPVPGKNFLPAALTALLGGWLGLLADMPGGVLMGSMLATVLLNVVWGKSYVPMDKRWILQLFGGLTIGARFTLHSLMQLTTILPAVAIALSTNVLMWISLSFLLMRLGKLDPETALLSACPGGLSDMVLVAMDMHSNAAQVAVLQAVRLVITVSCFPIVYALLGAL